MSTAELAQPTTETDKQRTSSRVPRCPTCGEKAKRVSAITVRAMLTPDALGSLGDAEGFLFCGSTDCATVYAKPQSEQVFDAAQLRLAVFQKTEDLERPVCYCFGYSVRDVEQDARSRDPRILAEIREKCRGGLDRCEQENPQGSCCLGNVGKVAKMAIRTQLKDEQEAHECCARNAVTAAADAPAPPLAVMGVGDSGSKAGRSGLFAVGGAVMAAMLSSACCWLPLSLIAVGISAGGIGTFFDAYRVHFLSLTGLMLAAGFYLVYRKPKCAPGDACATPNRRLQKFNKVMLWAATAIIAVFALFPNYIGYVLGGDDAEPEGFSSSAIEAVPQAATPAAVRGAGANGVVREYGIGGMSCEGCTAHIRDTLRDVPGVSAVQISYEKKLARVTFAAGARADDEAVVAAIKELGFEATVQ